jgi:hypothetical protein
MTDNLGLVLLVLLGLAFVGAFFGGTQWNVRKGTAALKWLQQGLPLVGERTTMRWVGTAAVALNIAKAKDPFRSAETLILLEPRDVLFLWAFFRARGRRDLLIFRTQLQSAPKFELEAFDPRAWATDSVERDAQKKNWTRLELPASQSLRAYYSGAGGATSAKPLIDLATRAGGKLVRLSVHRSVPNLEIHWQLPEAAAHPARDLFLKVRQISEDVMRG